MCGRVGLAGQGLGGYRDACSLRSPWRSQGWWLSGLYQEKTLPAGGVASPHMSRRLVPLPVPSFECKLKSTPPLFHSCLKCL